MKQKWWIILIAILIIVAGIGGYFFYKIKKSAEVVINDQKFNVELAVTEAQRTKGLSGRDNLDASSGMLFVFPKSDIHTFWMKDTQIPLDVIWINDGKVVEVTTLDPDSPEFTPSYTPKNPANYVLEINAGLINENNIKVGDKVEIKI